MEGQQDYLIALFTCNEVFSLCPNSRTDAEKIVTHNDGFPQRCFLVLFLFSLSINFV